MFSIYLCATFLIANINLLAAIVQKRNRDLHPPHSLQLIHSNFRTNNYLRSDLNNVIKVLSSGDNSSSNEQRILIFRNMDRPKINSSISLEVSTQNYKNNISRKFIDYNSQSNDYISRLSGDLKPIYEDSESDDFLGYYYHNPTKDNVQVLTNKPKDVITQLKTQEQLTKTIEALDHFLEPLLNANSYNSALHPPVNPVLALILSRYGRYVPGNLNSHFYSYMAINNIHNHKPFGQYKYQYKEDSI